MKAPDRTPERAPCWNPNDDRYWDARDLEQETRRHFQVCHECRMCVTYCGSFPLLFDAVDRDVDPGRAEGAELTGAADFDVVADHCWQCKLCYIKCPYTEDEGSHELLDFPRLMLRIKAQRARRDGVPLVDKILGEPRALGAAAAGPGAGMANLINSQRLLRKVAEKTAGISAEFELPPMASEPFTGWMRSHQPAPEAGERGEVVLFSTCYGDFNFPEVPRAAVAVLEKNGWAVRWPEQLTCCGMPNLDGGDVAAATAKMRHNVEVLLPLVREGLKIVTPGPTCGYTMKHEWPVYVGTPEAREVADAVEDAMQFLDGLRRQKSLNKEFERGFGKVAYHAACHLRAQKVAIPGARVLSRLPDTEVRIVEQCSAVDGTWGMKAAYYDEGVRYARKMLRDFEPDPDAPELVVGDCNLAGLRLKKAHGTRMLHPLEALAVAYGLQDAPKGALPAEKPTETREAE